MQNRTLIFLALVILYSQGLSAYPVDALELTLDQSVEIALQNNTDLAIVKHRRSLADLQKSEALGAALPDLDLTARYQYEGNNPEIEFLGHRFKLVPDNSYLFNAKLEQYLYSGAIASGYRAARELFSGSEYDVIAMENRVVAEVNALFYRALYNRELISISEESVQQLKVHLKDSKDRESVGLNTSYDTLRFESQLAEARAVLVTGKNQYSYSILELLDYMSVDPTTSVQLKGSFQIKQLNINLSEALVFAMENRPEIKSAKESSKAAKDMAIAMRSQVFPTVKGFANYNLSNSSGFVESDELVDSWNAGINIKFNLFDGMERSSRYRKKFVESYIADLEHSRTIRRVRLEVKAAFDELARAKELLTSQSKNVEYAEETYRIASVSHREGVATQLKVLDAHLSLRKAKSNYSKSLYENNVARVKLLMALGGSYEK
jgi:outer membrane protein TolC